MKGFATCVGYAMIGAAVLFAVILALVIVGSNISIQRSGSVTVSPGAAETRFARATKVAGQIAATAMAKAVPTAFPTDYVYPTAGPRPTDTAVPTMTAVPLPTATLEPTVAPVNGLSASDRIYLAEMAAIFKPLGDHWTKLSSFTENPKPLSREWRVAVGVHIGFIKVAYQDIQNLMPPPRFEEFHGNLVQLQSECSIGLSYFASGIDNISKVDMDQGLVLLTSCDEKRDRALVELKELMN